MPVSVAGIDRPCRRIEGLEPDQRLDLERVVPPHTMLEPDHLAPLLPVLAAAGMTGRRLETYAGIALMQILAVVERRHRPAVTGEAKAGSASLTDRLPRLAHGRRVGGYGPSVNGLAGQRMVKAPMNSAPSHQPRMWCR